MAEIVRMPLLSDTMKEGVIAAWHKKVGDKVESDDVIAEVETDKATMEVMPYVDGTLLYVSDKKGIPVNGIMAIVGKEGEDISAILNEEDSTNVTPSDVSKQEEPAMANTAATSKAAKPDDSLATVIQMPLLSDTMKEGKIAAWLKNVGDKVASDDVIAEVETDKATMEVMPYADGVLLYQAVPAGKGVSVNGIMAIVGKEGTDVQPYIDYYSQPIEVQADTKQEAPAQKATAIAANSAPKNSIANSESAETDGRLKVSPLAKKMAKDKGIDLRTVKGSGDGGRIIKADIENYKTSAVANTTAAPAATASNANLGQESYRDIELSQMRKIIAQRLGESKFSAPHFYLSISVKMDKAIEALLL